MSLFQIEAWVSFAVEVSVVHYLMIYSIFIY